MGSPCDVTGDNRKCGRKVNKQVKFGTKSQEYVQIPPCTSENKRVMEWLRSSDGSVDHVEEFLNKTTEHSGCNLCFRKEVHQQSHAVTKQDTLVAVTQTTQQPWGRGVRIETVQWLPPLQ